MFDWIMNKLFNRDDEMKQLERELKILELKVEIESYKKELADMAKPSKIVGFSK